MTTVSRAEAIRLQANAMPEKELLALVTEAAKALGWKCFHTWRSDHSEAGFPDLVMLRGERGLVVELKREGKAATDAQSAWLDAFGDVHFDAEVWWPSDWLSGYITKVLT